MIDFIEMSLIKVDLLESEVFKELGEIFLVKQRELLLFFEILFLNGFEESLAVFEGMAVVEENNFEERVVGMRCFDLLFGICFEALVAEGLFMVWSVG